MRLSDYLRELDKTMRVATGKPLVVHVRRGMDKGLEVLDLWLAAKPSPATDTVWEGDADDCRFLGIDVHCDEVVAKEAMKGFRKRHHPDRSVGEGSKAGAEEMTKNGVACWDRICNRRGWKP